MQFETIYFVERKSKANVLEGDILEWTISLSVNRVAEMQKDLEETIQDSDTYYVIRSMIITD